MCYPQQTSARSRDDGTASCEICSSPARMPYSSADKDTFYYDAVYCLASSGKKNPSVTCVESDSQSRQQQFTSFDIQELSATFAKCGGNFFAGMGMNSTGMVWMDEDKCVPVQSLSITEKQCVLPS